MGSAHDASPALSAQLVPAAPRPKTKLVHYRVQGEGCYSVTEGERIDWAKHAVFVTPPGETHEHHNTGGQQARFLIVQDGGLHYHARTMDFGYDE
jgi:gentisate 1,2-dioxygenase